MKGSSIEKKNVFSTKRGVDTKLAAVQSTAVS